MPKNNQNNIASVLKENPTFCAVLALIEFGLLYSGSSVKSEGNLVAANAFSILALFIPAILLVAYFTEPCCSNLNEDSHVSSRARIGR